MLFIAFFVLPLHRKIKPTIQMKTLKTAFHFVLLLTMSIYMVACGEKKENTTDQVDSDTLNQVIDNTPIQNPLETAQAVQASVDQRLASLTKKEKAFKSKKLKIDGMVIGYYDQDKLVCLEQKNADSWMKFYMSEDNQVLCAIEYSQSTKTKIVNVNHAIAYFDENEVYVSGAVKTGQFEGAVDQNALTEVPDGMDASTADQLLHEMRRLFVFLTTEGEYDASL